MLCKQSTKISPKARPEWVLHKYLLQELFVKMCRSSEKGELHGPCGCWEAFVAQGRNVGCVLDRGGFKPRVKYEQSFYHY